ncbi:hypothetical protein F909_03495 [Acinetobacter sp. ANC 3929]|uniref:DUF3108 domain-containing protein n=1 Tax=unclassified Acinetobacter TaxID=196816 RepID=UPI0002CFDE1B|nr:MULTISPECIES: DUF3108 domain-containing protein [unclassified Acinetobacter]ENW79168.1 hypothetical protein F909_03495 [Acinetobacter sp. ANC 3929]MCH7351072.1 DUF3108 domain-containing protein [Acinetobacter sp. NIPH 2023]MCH7354924.1 DUF3108 domain-containing protein [Acinetobacter sp. NIPH 1958]MCH7358555.1 DUF3108 domain-containing protein [Acinetobacter sp. NIPH 2024]
MTKQLLKVLGITSATLLSVSLSSHALAMAPFQASYQFSYNNKNLGSATRTLSQQGNNWVYQFNAKAGAIASASESSQFSFADNKITSQKFSRSSKVLIHNNTMSIDFNPNSKVVNTKKDDTARSFAWQAGALDELNAELQVREDLKNNSLKTKYLIADAKALDERRFVKQGNESIKTPYGTFNTIKVVMQHDKPERNTVFWLAPKLDYLPVKMAHNDGKTSYGLLLTGYSGKTN